MSSEVRPVVEAIINEKLSFWFDQNPKFTKLILAKIIQSAIAREVARKARENVRRKCIRYHNAPRKIGRLSIYRYLIKLSCL